MIQPIFKFLIQKTGDFWNVVVCIEPEDGEVLSVALFVRGYWNFEVTACHSEDCAEYEVVLVENMQWRKTYCRS